MYFTSGSDRAFEQLMQTRPGADHFDSGEAGAPEDCGTCRFYRPHWKYQFCIYAECPYQPGKLTVFDTVKFQVKGVCDKMAVFRVEKNRGYTVMSNHHLRNKDLSLKAKGLLSQMLSLPEGWDYTLKGLSLINRESIDAIRTAVWELERAGYITRQQNRDGKGKMADMLYTIYEQPQTEASVLEQPILENPVLENPTSDNPTPENPTQINKDRSSKEKSNTDGRITDSIPILSPPSPLEKAAAAPPERKGTGAKSQSAVAVYREIIKDTIVNACDAGREGELIFRLVYKMTGCRKPVLRLWISSMEDGAIREGFSDLRPGADYEALYQSALCRQKADWLVGINATRLFSVLYHRTLNVGRVQTPTLAMMADRDAKITLFHKEKYHLLRLTLDGAEAVSEKFTDPAEAEQAAAMCKGVTVTCTSVTKEQKKEQPPKLYDLTTLQREANRLFGYTAKQTLDYAQSLYEKKLLTYPRTDSRYLTSDMAETASCVIHLAAKLPPFDGCGNFFPLVEAMISDKDVSDHHAIIPTMEIEKADIKGLPLGERNLFLLVCCRLLCASAEPYMYEAVTATFDCGGYSFAAKGKRILSEGWREIDRIFRAFLKEKPADGDGDTLPDFTKGQTFGGAEVAVTEHFTQPPKPYSEDTLLSAMENAGKDDIPDEAERKGLGTPATRAAIIEKLVAAGFVERKGKNLIPTKAGINLVTVLPEPLTSPMLTAEWEQKLTEIARGGADPDTFMDGICTMVQEIVSTYSCISEDGKKLFAPEKEVIGTCPRCGQSVYEGKNNFACSDRSCGFVLWKNDRFWTSRKKELTKKMATDLLKKDRTNVKGMWSEKKQTTYDAAVILNDTGGKYINFKLEFPKRKEGVNGRK